MSEIEKMYSNANIKICKRKQGFTLKDCTDKDCKECGYYDMPLFTTEKQLELIKLLAFRDYITIVAYMNGEYHSEHDKYNANENSLEGCLASLINNLWQDLTEEDKTNIKNILEM